MKHYLTLLFIFALSASYSQKHIKINNTGQLKLLGSFEKDLLNEEPFSEWFAPNYDTFEIDKSALNKIRSRLTDIDSIQVFFGTWCGDSKLEVPRFLKIMDELKYEDVQLIGVDNIFQNYKQSPYGEEYGLNIHRVPTFIMYKDSVEIGRIVESPVESLTEDLNDILSGNKYIPNYHIVDIINELLNERGYEYIVSHQDSLKDALKPLAENYYALNTYGYKLFTSFKIAEAEVVFNLNCALFEDNCSPYYTLSRFYARIGNKTLAKLALTEGLLIEPENEKLLNELKRMN